MIHLSITPTAQPYRRHENKGGYSFKKDEEQPPHCVIWSPRIPLHGHDDVRKIHGEQSNEGHHQGEKEKRNPGIARMPCASNFAEFKTLRSHFVDGASLLWCFPLPGI